MGCECNSSGFCNRHNMEKNPAEYNLCKTERGFNLYEKRNDIKKPTLLKQVYNITSSLINDIYHGMPIVSDEIYNERINTCKNCPLYEKNRCKSCGCYVEIKARIASEECPEKLWLAQTADKKCGSCGQRRV